MNLREQRLWLEAHPGMPLDENISERQDAVVTVEPYPDAEEDIARLLPEHLREIDEHLSHAIPELDKEFYRRLWDIGTLYVVTARDNAELVGYIVTAINRHPHYRGQICAFGTLCYVIPEYRGRGIFSRMLQESERVVGYLGIGMIAMGARLTHDSGKSLVKCGFSPLETAYLKVFR